MKPHLKQTFREGPRGKVQSLFESHTYDSVYFVLACFQDPQVKKAIDYEADDKCLNKSHYVKFVHSSSSVSHPTNHAKDL